MRLVAALTLLAALLLAAAGCQLILGEHEIYGVRQPCDEDNDCDVKGGEVCSSSYDGVCRTACTGETELVDCGVRAECSSSWGEGSCNDELGTPCDPEDSGSCGSVSCLDRSDHKDLVLGYCTKSCNDQSDPPKPCPTGTQGHAYVCIDSECVRVKGSGAGGAG